jgi:hypothetical protein
MNEVPRTRNRAYHGAYVAQKGGGTKRKWAVGEGTHTFINCGTVCDYLIHEIKMHAKIVSLVPINV